MPLRILLCLLLAVAWSAATAFAEVVERPEGFEAMVAAPPLKDSLQLVLVAANGWDDSQAVMYRFSRETTISSWEQVGDAVPCRAGSLGLAWGRGLHYRNPGWGPQKAENDGRAPAGAFSLPRIFGRVPAGRAAALGSDMPYTALNAATVCVTDRNSPYYNELVDPTRLPSQDWEQAMAMAARDEAYAWGVVVDHNRFPPTPGNDACVFLHSGDGEASNGTALPVEAVEELALWLDYPSNPVLVQLPRQECALLAQAWGLPPL